MIKSGAVISIRHDQVVIGSGRKEMVSTPKENEKPAFYFPDFFLEDPKPWYQYEESEQLTTEQLATRLPASGSPNGRSWSIQGDEIYSNTFSRLQISFQKGELKKAVPYLFYTSDQPFKVQQSLLSLLNYSSQHPTFLYGFWEDEKGILGGSPELLFQIASDGILTTAAIAGTVESAYEDRLLSDPKLKIEHDLVIEGICASLAPFGKAEVGKTEILRLSHLSHAKTPISVQLERIDCIDALTRALHPTPALGAFPKAGGLNWLANYAKLLPRGRYGAPVGVKIGNHFSCYVAIRNIQWEQGCIRLGVGGGVVRASNEKDERDELALKFEATRSMLNI